MIETLELMVRRAWRRLTAKPKKAWTGAEYAAQFTGATPAVQKLIDAIEKALPVNAGNSYATLSPGQKALAEAKVYLSYQLLPKAREICSEALGDPSGPGDQWVKDLMDAIDIAAQMPGTDAESGKARRQDLHERRQARHTAQYRQVRGELESLQQQDRN